jgi:hypothetical protein
METGWSYPPSRLLVPLPVLEGPAPAYCPVCASERAMDQRGVAYSCGAGWPPEGEALPCPRPAAAFLLSRLRRWCGDEDLHEVAAFLRRQVAAPCERMWAGLGSPVWLLPQSEWECPPTECPSCGANVSAVLPHRWHYHCGSQLLELPRSSREPSQTWRSCHPCRQPPVMAVVVALAMMPRSPLRGEHVQRLEELLHERYWI